MTAPVTWLPYCGAGPVPVELLARWNFDPALLTALASLGFLYWRASAQFPERRPRLAAAMAMTLFLFVSPFCALTSALFSARTLHHVLLIGLLAPLIVAALPAERVKPPGGLAVWTAAQTFVFWLWHAPPVYGWALSSNGGYWLMQLSLLSSAIGFWAALRRAAMPGAIASLLATMVQMGLLGALLTFAGAPLFAPHYLTTLSWSLSPLEDQQLAGLIMWAPSAGSYLAAALILAWRWIGRDTAQARAA
jgi:putative membrane protein